MRQLQQLEDWFHTTPGLVILSPDYHRLQLEHFLWKETHNLTPLTQLLEIGVEFRKEYLTTALGSGYVTMNDDDPTETHNARAFMSPSKPDTIGDICNLPFPDHCFDIVVSSETFEHVYDPWKAIREVYRVLKPGGKALLTTPFLWPWHGCSRYADYWRFTADGWRLLCREFTSVRVYPIEFRQDSGFTGVMEKEMMGSLDLVEAATGYLVKAVR